MVGEFFLCADREENGGPVRSEGNTGRAGALSPQSALGDHKILWMGAQKDKTTLANERVFAYNKKCGKNPEPAFSMESTKLNGPPSGTGVSERKERRMLADTLRVSLSLEPEADADAVLAAMEESLNRKVVPIHRLRTVPVLSVALTRSELERIRRIPGIRSAEEERRHELPPAPRAPKRELK